MKKEYIHPQADIEILEQVMVSISIDNTPTNEFKGAKQDCFGTWEDSNDEEDY